MTFSFLKTPYLSLLLAVIMSRSYFCGINFRAKFFFKHQTTGILLKSFSFQSCESHEFILSKMKDKELNQCFVLCSKCLGSLVSDTEQAAAYKPYYCLCSSDQRGHLLLSGQKIIKTPLYLFSKNVTLRIKSPLRYLALILLIIVAYNAVAIS